MNTLQHTWLRNDSLQEKNAGRRRHTGDLGPQTEHKSLATNISTFPQSGLIFPNQRDVADQEVNEQPDGGEQDYKEH